MKEWTTEMDSDHQTSVQHNNYRQAIKPSHYISDLHTVRQYNKSSRWNSVTNQDPNKKVGE